MWVKTWWGGEDREIRQYMVGRGEDMIWQGKRGAMVGEGIVLGEGMIWQGKGCGKGGKAMFGIW